MEQDERFMREALREARAAAAEDEVPIGAVVVCRGRVIAKGHNMVEALSDPTAHAEMIAITAACEAVGGKYRRLLRAVFPLYQPVPEQLSGHTKAGKAPDRSGKGSRIGP